LIEAQTTSGKWVKAFTLMLKPAPVKAEAPVKLPLSASPQAQAPQAPTEHVVQIGESASQIIQKWLSEDMSTQQMLLALLKNQPDAFIQGNVNLIKAGAILKLPTAAEATQISRAEARQTVMAQSRDFAEYGRRLADSPMSVGSHPSREVMGKVTPETTDGLSNLPQQDKLTLSKSQVNTHSAEATLAAEREAKDAAAQMQALKKNLKDLEGLAKGQNPSGKSADTASSNPAVRALSRSDIGKPGIQFSAST
jgi:pilus assembly protein FimV